MKNALRWTLSLSFLALIAVACQQATDSPTAPSNSAGRTEDESGTISAQAGPSGPTNAGPSGGSGAGPTTGGAGPGTGGAGGGSGSGGGSGGGGGLPPGGGGGSGTPTPPPGATPTPTPTPEPPPVEILSTAPGSTFEICEPAKESGCPFPFVEEEWTKSTAFQTPSDYFIRTSLGDAVLSDPTLVTIRATRLVRVDVFFNNSGFPSLPGSCTPRYPAWALDGTGWEHGGVSVTLTNVADPNIEVRSDNRNMVLNPGDTVDLGPNEITGCTSGYVPLMYWIHLYAP